VTNFPSTEAEWRAWLEGTHPLIKRGQRTLRFLPSGPRCKLCSAPFGAPPEGHDVDAVVLTAENAPVGG